MPLWGYALIALAVVWFIAGTANENGRFEPLRFFEYVLEVAVFALLMLVDCGS